MTMHTYHKSKALGLLGGLCKKPHFTAIVMADVRMMARNNQVQATQASAGALLGCKVRKAGGPDLANKLKQQTDQLTKANKLVCAIFNVAKKPCVQDTTIRDIFKKYAGLPVAKYGIGRQTAILGTSVFHDILRAAAPNSAATNKVAALVPLAATQSSQPLLLGAAPPPKQSDGQGAPSTVGFTPTEQQALEASMGTTQQASATVQEVSPEPISRAVHNLGLVSLKSLQGEACVALLFVMVCCIQIILTRFAQSTRTHCVFWVCD
jgi:hypothetical protein